MASYTSSLRPHTPASQCPRQQWQSTFLLFIYHAYFDSFFFFTCETMPKTAMAINISKPTDPKYELYVWGLTVPASRSSSLMSCCPGMRSRRMLELVTQVKCVCLALLVIDELLPGHAVKTYVRASKASKVCLPRAPRD